jgi:hypothetical protein
MHVAEKDFPRLYNLSWREQKGKCSIILGFSRDAVEVITEKLNENSPILRFSKEEFGFKIFRDNFNAKKYGYDECATINQLKDGSVELIFDLIFIKDKEAMQYIYACAATINAIVLFLEEIPEKEIRDPLPQFMQLRTLCYRHKVAGHGGSIHGEMNKDVKKYLINHFNTKGEVLNDVLKALLKAAEIMSGEKKKAERNLYWAEVRSETGFLSINCPGNSCGLNTEKTDEHYWLIKEGKKEEDFGMDLICHNVDGIMQQMLLLAALAALSDEVKKYYLENIGA